MSAGRWLVRLQCRVSVATAVGPAVWLALHIRTMRQCDAAAAAQRQTLVSERNRAACRLGWRARGVFFCTAVCCVFLSSSVAYFLCVPCSVRWYSTAVIGPGASAAGDWPVYQWRRWRDSGASVVRAVRTVFTVGRAGPGRCVWPGEWRHPSDPR